MQILPLKTAVQPFGHRPQRSYGAVVCDVGHREKALAGGFRQITKGILNAFPHILEIVAGKRHIRNHRRVGNLSKSILSGGQGLVILGGLNFLGGFAPNQSKTAQQIDTDKKSAFHRISLHFKNPFWLSGQGKNTYIMGIPSALSNILHIELLEAVSLIKKSVDNLTHTPENIA